MKRPSKSNGSRPHSKSRQPHGRSFPATILFGIVTGGNGDFDSFGNSDPRILGREFEVKDVLSFIEQEGITGVVSLTSDVHFTAHVNMHPDRAEGGFTEFKPLDEFVIGPIHAGSFGPNFMDTSFGAEYQYGE